MHWLFLLFFFFKIVYVFTIPTLLSSLFLCLDPSTFFVNNSFHLECFFPISHNNIQFNIASIFLTHSGNPKVGHPTCTTWTQSRASSITSPTIITNHAILLVLSDQHQAADLKEAAIRFINKNAPAVMMMPSWPAFSKNHQNLLVELYRKLLE